MVFDFGLVTALRFHQCTIYFDALQLASDGSVSFLKDYMIICVVSDPQLSNLIWADRHVMLDNALQQSACG